MTMNGGDEVEETPEQKELSRIAAERWNFAQDKLAPMQNDFMSAVDQLDSGGRKSYVAGRANVGTQNAVSQAMTATTTGVAARDNLSSGSAKGALADVALAGASAGADSSSRGLFEVDNQKAVGLQNVVALGSGEEASAIAGLEDVASLSQAKARNDAMNSFNTNTANQRALGQLAGAGLSYGMHNSSGGQPAPLAVNTTWQSADQQVV